MFPGGKISLTLLMKWKRPFKPLLLIYKGMRNYFLRRNHSVTSSQSYAFVIIKQLRSPITLSPGHLQPSVHWWWICVTMLLCTQDILKNHCAHWLAMSNMALFIKEMFFYFSLVNRRSKKMRLHWMSSLLSSKTRVNSKD